MGKRVVSSEDTQCNLTAKTSAITAVVLWQICPSKAEQEKAELDSKGLVHAAMNDGLKWIAPPCKMPTADKAVRLHLMFDCGNSLKYIPNCREKYNEPSCTHHPAQKLTT